MTSLKAGVEVLKSDDLGRVRVPKERRETLLDEFERSGMSAAKFAQLTGIKYPTFANWAARRRKGRALGAMEAAVEPGNPGAVRLVEAFVGELPPSGAGGLQIDLPGGARLQVISPLQLQMAAELLRMLRSTGRSAC